MKRIDRIRSMSVDEMAKLIVESNTTDAFCKSDCGLDDCTHPVECCKCWLESEVNDSGKIL